MHKRRLVFTLLFGDGSFHLSRNFRLQAIGDVDWLERNYAFERTAAAIDELVMIDVSRGGADRDAFEHALRRITRTAFVPITAGGWVRTEADAQRLLASGADKVLVNGPALEDPALVEALARRYGAQCVVAAVDVARGSDGEYEVRVAAGGRPLPGSAREHLDRVAALPIGDLYLNSIDRDGTGQGYDLAVLDLLPADVGVPVVMAGGPGNWRHLAEGLADPRVDAVATAHLLNFVGDGLLRAREQLVDSGYDLPLRTTDVRDLRNAAVS